MARIPDVTDLGDRPIAQARTPRVIDQSGEILAQGIGQLGDAAGHLADVVHTQRVNMARAQASNALLDHEIAVKEKADDIQTRVESGALSYEDAQATFKKESDAITKPDIKYLDPIGNQNLQKGLERNAFAGQVAVKKIADDARKINFKDQFTGGLDKLGKLAGMPGADIESINRKAESFAPLARAAGVPANVVDQAIQNFKDRTWLNDATQRSMEAKDSLPALKQLEHDLTAKDGFYSGKLDTDRRNAVLNSVINNQLQIENKIQHAQDKREAKAERTLNQIDQQIASGVPATAEMWSNWESMVKGTQVSDEFKQRLQDEEQVQNVLRKPIGDQMKLVQDKESVLDNQGGTVRDRANLGRLKSAVQANVKLMQEAPLLYNANRTGQQVAPLDLTSVGDPNSGVSDQIASRMASLAAMRKEYGTQIPLRPLLPQEAQQLTGLLDKSTPQQQAGIFAALDKAMGDTQAYKGTMQQIAPDAPVKALAGMLAAKESSITLENHWFRPNEIATSGNVATTLLEGERLLDATKGQKAEDGKPKTGLYLPEDATLQTEFQNHVGTAFAGRSGSANVAYQAVKVYYVGRAAQLGRLASTKQDIDTGLVKEAITATLGSVVDFNGQGEVLAPWGMDASTFNDRASAAWLAQAKRLDISKDIPRIGLKNQGEGTYYVTQGKNYLYGKDGKPIVIDVTK